MTFDGDLDEARAPLSVTLVLDRELDISRGDLIVASSAPATVAKTVKAALIRPHQRSLHGFRNCCRCTRSHNQIAAADIELAIQHQRHRKRRASLVKVSVEGHYARNLRAPAGRQHGKFVARSYRSRRNLSRKTAKGVVRTKNALHRKAEGRVAILRGRWQLLQQRQ